MHRHKAQTPRLLACPISFCFLQSHSFLCPDPPSLRHTLHTLLIPVVWTIAFTLKSRTILPHLLLCLSTPLQLEFGLREFFRLSLPVCLCAIARGEYVPKRRSSFFEYGGYHLWFFDVSNTSFPGESPRAFRPKRCSTTLTALHCPLTRCSVMLCIRNQKRPFSVECSAYHCGTLRMSSSRVGQILSTVTDTIHYGVLFTDQNIHIGNEKRSLRIRRGYEL